MGPDIIQWLKEHAKRTTIEYMGEEHGYDVCIWYFFDPRNTKQMAYRHTTNKSLKDALNYLIMEIENEKHAPQYA